MSKYFEPVSRREFIKKGITGGVVISTYPLWRHYAFAATESDFQVNPINDLSRKTIEKLLEQALEYGGEFAEVYAEYSVVNSIYLEENKIYNAKRGIDMGVGIRVLHGEKTGYAFSDDLDKKRLNDTARVAGLIAAGKRKKNAVDLKSLTHPNYYQVRVLPDTIIPAEKGKLLTHANEVARAYDNRIIQVSVSFGDTNKKIVIANSEGLWTEDTQVQTNLYVGVDCKEGEKRSYGYDYKNGTLGFEHYSMDEAEMVAKRACKSAIAMLPAEDSPAGEYPIVLASGYCGTLFHEAIGHGFELDSIRKKGSCYWDKKGQMVASELVTLVDDGTCNGLRGSINIDDEGTPGSNTVLIEKGKCINFMNDYLNAGLMKTKLTGNGRRESYQYYPIPRMTNTYPLAGEDEPEDIIKSVKKGLYIGNISGGNVATVTGNFVFSVQEGYLIEDGRITTPLKGIQLMGNGPEVLKNIVMVGHDLKLLGGGTCGKAGQGKPVSDGNPTMKVAKITIGGSSV